MSGWKLKFACFDCRKMFRYDPERWHIELEWIIEPVPVCPDCGKPYSFQAPRRARQKDMGNVATLLQVYRSIMPFLKPKFACFACRKMFRIDPSRFYWDKDLKRMVTDHPPTCPDCGALMRRVNRDFRPPRREDKQAWESAELLYLSGHSVASDTEGGSRERIDRVGQAKRHIDANPHRKSEGATVG